MIYKINIKLEEVIEQGLYEGKRKFEIMEPELEGDDMGGQKKMKKDELGVDGTKENISLGSIGLKQFEEMQQKNDEISKMQKYYMLEVGLRKKIEVELDKALKNFKRLKKSDAEMMLGKLWRKKRLPCGKLRRGVYWK